MLLLRFRRLLHDDSRGVGEALNEEVCALEECKGLTVSILNRLHIRDKTYF